MPFFFIASLRTCHPSLLILLWLIYSPWSSWFSSCSFLLFSLSVRKRLSSLTGPFCSVPAAPGVIAGRCRVWLPNYQTPLWPTNYAQALDENAAYPNVSRAPRNNNGTKRLRLADEYKSVCFSLIESGIFKTTRCENHRHLPAVRPVAPKPRLDFLRGLSASRRSLVFRIQMGLNCQVMSASQPFTCSHPLSWLQNEEAASRLCVGGCFFFPPSLKTQCYRKKKQKTTTLKRLRLHSRSAVFKSWTILA